MCFDFFEFPQHKSFRGVKEFQETTKEVLELEERAAAVRSSKKKGKLNAAMKRKQAQLTGAPPAPPRSSPPRSREDDTNRIPLLRWDKQHVLSRGCSRVKESSYPES